jgi:beta-phosphoglucomutase
MSAIAVARAVIFDFDGVLADTEELHCAAFQAVAASIGAALSTADYFQHLLGLPDRECLAALCEQAGLSTDPVHLEELVSRKRVQFARLSQTAALYPGVADTLRRLHGDCLLAIASGAFRDEIEPLLARAGVRSLFSAVVGAEDVRAGKPAPDPFLHALHEVERASGSPVSASQCVVVEDSPRGVAAARAAGMRCIAVTTHHDRATLAAADAVIERVDQLRLEDLRL